MQDPGNGSEGRYTAGLAIGMVTYQSLADLRRFFAGHVSAARELGVPLVLVDNGSSDGSPEHVEHAVSAGAPVRLVRNERNGGYASAVNQAFDEAGERDVLLLNPDVELRDTQPVLRLQAELSTNPQIGVLAPQLLNPDGSTQSSARRFPSLLGMAGHASAARRLPAARRAADRYLEPPTLGRATRVDWAIGAALLVRRAAFDAVGGFDPRFFLYLEDTDFCLRCSRAGWETWYQPEVALYHLHDRASDLSRGGVLRSRARRHHVASIVRFFTSYPELALGRPWRAPSRSIGSCA